MAAILGYMNPFDNQNNDWLYRMSDECKNCLPDGQCGEC